ncbi:sulfotransferase domain-containing protein [Phenylobacterium sp. J367]|uniref:sulfotransferase domain-containing protein n=1 Tax=Phenylobacterium sp. J367 TaxID=2898435 RepID=UPI0021512B87|nr:sulfotransferase domain-containing protein [Phenylobacterium sp. J367]MCR5877530.1 sulfotransferase domain-containing protein [Phenylobacterium sp. J367]
MADEPRVDFIIAGVQKGGTTALFDYLSDEPRIALPRVKEVHFFDDEGQDWAQPDYGAYHAHWDAPPDGRPRGEATPIYVYWPNSLERIAAYNPAMKLIVLLRDPVQRAWSHWRMEYARGRRDPTLRLVHPGGPPAAVRRRALGPSPGVLLRRARLLRRAARAALRALPEGAGAGAPGRGPAR